MTSLRASVRVDLIDNASPNAKKIEQATQNMRQAQMLAAQSTQVIARAELEAAQAALVEVKSKDTSATSSLNLAKAELTVAQAAGKLAKAEHDAARASQQHAQSASGVTAANKSAAYAMAAQVNTVGELAYSFGNLSPATRGLGMSMVMAGGNAFAFAGSMGVAGVALGTAVGVIPGLISLYQELQKEIGGAGTTAAEAAKQFNELMDARVEEMRQRRRQQDILAGEGSVDETQAAIGVAQDEQANARARLNLGQVGFSDLANPTTRAALMDVALTSFGRGYTAPVDRFADQQSRAVQDVQTATGTVERLRTEALPRAMAREEQERRVEIASTTAQEAAAAQRELQRRLEDERGLTSSQRQQLMQATTSGGHQVNVPGLLRGLPADVGTSVLGDIEFAANAAARARIAQGAADRAPLRSLNENIATDLAAGEQLGTVRVAGGGGAGGAERTELQLANTASPLEEAARALTRAAEQSEEASRRSLEAARSQERAAERSERLASGPSVLGGAE